MLEDRFEQRAQVGGIVIGRELGKAGFGIGVDYRKVQLIFGRIQIDEQVVDLVQDLLDARIRPVVADLIVSKLTPFLEDRKNYVFLDEFMMKSKQLDILTAIPAKMSFEIEEGLQKYPSFHTVLFESKRLERREQFDI